MVVENVSMHEGVKLGFFLRVSFTDQSRFGDGVESLETHKLNSEAANICS